MEQKNKNIEEILNSFDNIAQAEANPFLFEKIQHRIKVRKEKANVLYRKRIVFVTACLSGMILVNSFILFNSNSKPKQSQNESSIETISNEYFAVSTYNY